MAPPVYNLTAYTAGNHSDAVATLAPGMHTGCRPGAEAGLSLVQSMEALAITWLAQLSPSPPGPGSILIDNCWVSGTLSAPDANFYPEVAAILADGDPASLGGATVQAFAAPPASMSYPWESGEQGVIARLESLGMRPNGGTWKAARNFAGSDSGGNPVNNVAGTLPYTPPGIAGWVTFLFWQYEVGPDWTEYNNGAFVPPTVTLGSFWWPRATFSPAESAPASDPYEDPFVNAGLPQPSATRLTT